jgi:hypothetical protein
MPSVPDGGAEGMAAVSGERIKPNGAGARLRVFWDCAEAFSDGAGALPKRKPRLPLLALQLAAAAQAVSVLCIHRLAQGENSLNLICCDSILNLALQNGFVEHWFFHCGYCL